MCRVAHSVFVALLFCVFSENIFIGAFADEIRNINELKVPEVENESFDHAEDEKNLIYEEVKGDFMNEEQKLKLSQTKEKHTFGANTERLMDIIVNNLYKSNDVSIRELISNAADALEKERFLEISMPNKGEKDSIGLDIRIDYDKEAKTVSITDTGIGMTKQDLINNLGTVAKSGTANFLESLAQGADVNLIGQFGVGFYAAFLVADKVTLTTKHDDDIQWIWESSADGSYSVAEDPRGNTLIRGTRVTLHLKDDATEFLNQSKLKGLASNYGKFISYPIYLRVEKTVTEEVPVDDDETIKKEEDVEVKDDDGEKEKKKFKKVEKKISEWELINPDKAIWLRPKEEVDIKDYNEFYKSLTKDWADPLIHVHFTAEGEIEFKALLYIPSRAPSDMFENYFNAQGGNIKMYVRRAFVGDKFENLLPKYLNFVKGVISSDDLPLNVSREEFQQHKLLPMLQKKLTKKVLELIRKMLNDSEALKKELKEKISSEDDAEKKKVFEKELAESTKFDKFWKEYSRNMKLGCYDDSVNKSKIAKVLKFYSSKSGDEQITLDHYVENVKKSSRSQNAIYYASGDSLAKLKAAPSYQIFEKKGIEVLFLLEAMDEPCIQKLTDYDSMKFVAIMKGDVDLDLTEEEKIRLKKLKKLYDPLLKWMHGVLASKVQKVEISTRLTSDPCVVVASQWGYSAQMEKVMKAQTFADPTQVQIMANQKIFEINPNHPVMLNLLEKVKANKNDKTAKAITATLFQAAMLASGFDIENPADLSNTIYEYTSRSVGIDPNAEIKDVNVDDVEDEDETTADNEGEGFNAEDNNDENPEEAGKESQEKKEERDEL